MTLNELANGSALWVALIAIFVICGAVLFWRVAVSKTELAVQRRSRMFNVAERNFFECLSKALQDDFYLFTRVSVADVVEPSPASGRLQLSAFKKRYSDTYLDYVLCKKHDLSIYGVVELENFDKDGRSKIRAEREQLISDVSKAANLRLFYFDTRQDYRDVDIRRLITGRGLRYNESSVGTHQSQLTLDGASVSDFSRVRACPQCDNLLVTKVALKGSRIGEKFLMCRDYPHCDYRISVDDAKALKQLRQQELKATKPSFSQWSAS